MGETPSPAADPSRRVGASGPDAPPSPSGFAQGPRPGPGQGDTPWQRADGPAAPAPAPEPDSSWVTGGAAYRGPDPDSDPASATVPR